MSQDDILAAAILIAAYLSTWILFLRSLRIVKILDREHITGLAEFRKRFGLGRRNKTESRQADRHHREDS